MIRTKAELLFRRPLEELEASWREPSLTLDALLERRIAARPCSTSTELPHPDRSASVARDLAGCSACSSPTRLVEDSHRGLAKTAARRGQGLKVRGVCTVRITVPAFEDRAVT